MTKTSDDDRSTPVRDRRTRGAETRDAILGVAIDQIGRVGFEGLRIRDVAKEVGINNATLHHHYPTKEDLIAGVVERFVANFEGAQSGQLEGDPAGRFDRYLASTRALMDAEPAMFVIMNELLLRAARDPAVAKLVAPSQERWMAYILHLLADLPMSDDERRVVAERSRYEMIGESLARGAKQGLSLPLPD